MRNEGATEAVATERLAESGVQADNLAVEDPEEANHIGQGLEGEAVLCIANMNVQCTGLVGHGVDIGIQ